MNGPIDHLNPVANSDLPVREDFRQYVDDISESIQFALERRHLDNLDLRSFPDPEELSELPPGDLRFLHLVQIGHGADIERSLDLVNVENILGSYRGVGHGLVVAVSSDGETTDLYLGARKLDDPGRRPLESVQDFLDNVRKSFESNLPGSKFQVYGSRPAAADGTTREPDYFCPRDRWRERIVKPLNEYENLAAITGIPSLRGERNQQFGQSLDRLIHSLQGQPYLFLFIAEPLPEVATNRMMKDCLKLSSDLHAWVKLTGGLTTGENWGKGVSSGVTTGVGDSTAEGVNDGISNSKTTQEHPLVGGALGAGLGLMLSSFVPGAGPIAYGVMSLTNSISSGLFGSKSTGTTQGTTTTKTKSWNESLTKTINDNQGGSRSSALNFEYLNKAGEYTEKLLEGSLERIRRGRNLGLWNVGVYFFAPRVTTFNQGQAQIKALFSGENSHHEPIRSIDLSKPSVRVNVLKVLETFSNPVLTLSEGHDKTADGQRLPSHPLPTHPLGVLYQGLSTPLNTEEVALLLNLPRREVPGIRLQEVADFGVNPKPFSQDTAIELGHIVASGTETNIRVGLDRSDLNRHIFVTGITGAGKTNTCFSLLKRIHEMNYPFLVIEPAKGEYRNLMSDRGVPGLRVYTPGNETISPFRINPFQFVPGTNLITHLDNLKAIFNASFPMYASMPYILEEAIVECYQDHGWDLVNSKNRNFSMKSVVDTWRDGTPDYSYTDYLPTLTDLIVKVEEVVKGKGFAQEVTSNFAGALKARLSSLRIGSKGKMFDVHAGIGFETLFESPTVLELRGVGDDDEKCFLMALVLVQLYEYREMCHRWKPGGHFRHLTVLEESHRLLGNAGGPVGNSEVANPRGKAVDTFANMLSEIREYGEGFLIVDQTPAKLVPDVVKNTSTKIMHRISALDDRNTMGDAMGLNDHQKLMISRLEVGDAIFQSQGLEKAIWIKIPPAKGGALPYVEDREIVDRMAQETADLNEKNLSRMREANNARLTTARTKFAESISVLQKGLQDFKADSAGNSAIAVAAAPKTVNATCILSRAESHKGCVKSVTLQNAQYSVKVPPQTLDGQSWRYRGLIKNPGGDQNSDLIVTFTVRPV